jgi:serine phosphatase RsbU (regulator of sigma subunit)
MQTTDLIEKFSFRVKAFQEGFEILSASRTLDEMAKNFCHVVRGSLMITYINLYYKPAEGDTFTGIYEQKKSVSPDLNPYITEDAYTLNVLHDERSLLAVLPCHDNSMFAILVGPKLDQEYLDDDEKISLQLFVQLLDNAHYTFLMRQSEKKLIFSLNNRLLQMNNLIDTGIELSKRIDEKTLLSLTLERAVGMTNASGGEMVVKNGNKILHRINYPEKYSIKSEINGRPGESSLMATFNFQKTKYLLSLHNKETRKGLAPFDDTDRLLLDSLSRQTQAAIESGYLREKALEMETVKRELAIAATIQQRILPESLPTIDGYDISGINLPAIEVCGDYYDCMQINENKYALIMADVSGKGIPAALLVSSLQASLRIYFETDQPLILLAEKLNKLIYQSTTADKYLTMCICVLDIKSGTLEALNAGHNPPLIVHNDQTLTSIAPGGIPIGMADLGLSYQTAEYQLALGESILMFTDGITEAMDINENMYEDERLEAFYIKNRQKSAQEFVGDLINDVYQFVGGASQSDDITVLYLKRGV